MNHRTLLLIPLLIVSHTLLPAEEEPSAPLESFLFQAIEQGHYRVVKKVIAQGADINTNSDTHGDTPLIFAVRKLGELVERFSQKIFNDPLTFQEAYYNRLALIRLLAYHTKINIGAKNHEGKTALALAAEKDLLEVVTMLNNRNQLFAAESANQELVTYKNKISTLNVSDEIKRQILQILEKYTLSTNPAEIGKQSEYFNFLFSLPWNEETDDQPVMHEVAQTLEKHHYGLQKVKDKILEFIAVNNFNRQAQQKILCLVGPPGTGKTSIAQAIAQALGKKYTKISLGGVHERRAIKGLNKAYIGAEPGDILKGLHKIGSHNPVFLLDEIDKLGIGFHGDPAAALLEVLDPEQNKTFVDDYVEIPFDLSKVFFIATANSVHDIPRALFERMEFIPVSSYTREEKLHIAQNYLVPRALKTAGLQDTTFKLGDDVINTLIADYTFEAGVRRLTQLINTLCAKTARSILETGVLPEFTPDTLCEHLGPPLRHDVEQKFITSPTIGVAQGLYATSIEGGMGFFETVLVPGKGGITLTGNLGQSTKESAQIAYSYAQAHASELGIDSTLFEKHNAHINVIPLGSDGPSAGITLLSSIVSAFTKKPFDTRFAMTGELSLSGHVLPIGGLKEKIIAAKQLGVTKIIIPQSNVSDLSEFQDAIKDVEIIPVAHAHEVLEKVLSLKEMS